MDQSSKRKAADLQGNGEKRAKTKKQWRTPRKNDAGGPQPKAIQPGDQGIWVTCNRGREGKCIGEMRDLLTETAERLYPNAQDLQDGGRADKADDDDDEVDIEKVIKAEVEGIRKPGAAQLFTPIKIELECVIFFKTVAPVEPAKLVKMICEEALENSQQKRTRFAKRLSPMTLMGRASTDGLEKVAAEVLAPHFHQKPFQKRKFAIRPTLRNHSILTRDSIIKQVASIVGQGHEVDLKNYELLIIVEVYQNVCGVSVVDQSFERLKRYNISEIFEPTPKEKAREQE